MANDKRLTYKLASDQYDFNKNVQVIMATGADGSRLTVTFMTRAEAFDAKTGSKNEVRDALAKVIATRFEKSGIAVQQRVEDGYIAFQTSDKNAQSAQALYSYAEAAIKTVTSLTDKGIGLKTALEKALEQEKAAAPGKLASLNKSPVQIAVKTRIDKEEAAAAIMKSVKPVMKDADAAKLATALATKLATQYPTRPAIPADANNNPVMNRSTPKDPLFKAISDSVNENVIPDEGKRHYAVGEIFDAVEATYNGLGTSTQVPVRKRA